MCNVALELLSVPIPVNKERLLSYNPLSLIVVLTAPEA